MNNFPSLVDHVLVLLFGWALPLFSSLQGRKALRSIHFSEPVRKRFYLSNSLMLAVMACVVLISWLAQGRALAELGFRSLHPSSSHITLIILTAIVLALYGADLWSNLRRARHRTQETRLLLKRTPFLPRWPRELPAYVLMCVAAGVCEEIIYRGFMVTYFLPEPNGKMGWPVLAIIVPALLFSLAHHYQGWEAMAKIMLLSMLLALLFILGGSIGWVMALHFTIDLAAGISMMRVMRRADENSADDCFPLENDLT